MSTQRDPFAMTLLRAVLLIAVGGGFHPVHGQSAVSSGALVDPLVEAATEVVGFLRGEAGFDRIRLADTVSLCLGRESGGTCRQVPRGDLRDPQNWNVHSDELQWTYSFAPDPLLTELTTRIGVQYRCFEYPLGRDFPQLAHLPHVGLKLEPTEATSCLQSWNLTLVFAAEGSSPTLVGAVYDQWEW